MERSPLGLLVENDRRRQFYVRLVRPGDRYGRDDCLTYDPQEDGEEVDLLVEFYDFTYSSLIEKDSPFGERGQFIGRYYRATLLGEGRFGHGDLDQTGLDLQGDEPAWKLDAGAMRKVYSWLRSEAVSEAVSEAISEAKSEAKSGPEIAPEIPAMTDAERAHYEAVERRADEIAQYADSDAATAEPPIKETCNRCGSTVERSKLTWSRLFYDIPVLSETHLCADCVLDLMRTDPTCEVVMEYIERTEV